jgi:DMSO/TMAO reductase YedYZ molybdopterin-dependent catalytic subunit
VTERRIGRAAFLGVIGAGVTGVLIGSRLDRVAGGPLGDVGNVVPDAVKGLIPSGWRIYSINPPWPVFHPASYSLTITGHVEHPMRFDWHEFTSLPAAHQVTDFHCVTGWTVGNVHWAGVRLQTIWDIVKPLPTARYANFISMEVPYTDTLTMKQTTLPEVMLAHSMGGQPLAREHGAPIRLVIPEMYGYKGVKWLRGIELMPDLVPGYWERNGYDVDAWVGNSNGY